MRKLLLVSLFCTLISGECFSQRYYYAFNEKRILNEVENKMIISFQRSGIDDVNTLINLSRIIWQNDSVCIVNVENARKETLRKDLIQIKGVKSVQSMYMNVDSLEMGITSEIVMKFNEDVSQQQIDELHKKHQVSVRKRTDLYYLVSVPNNVDALEVANQYQLSGLVKYSHPNFMANVEKHQTTPNDPYFVNQFYLHNTGQTMANGKSGTSGADIRVPQAWDITKGSSDIIVAVLDEGVTSNHPDLPNNRQVRLNGSNFAATPPDNDPSPVGNNNHGNSCAGVIAASHNNEGVAGIAPNSKIMPIRIPFGNYPSSIYADAIRFAKNSGAHILSNSWGYGSSDPNLFPDIVDAIEDATLTGRNGKGCVVVISAGNTASHVWGNSGTVNFPSNVNVAGVLTVGASDRYDQQANYSPTSNLNSPNNQIVDIVAPSHRAYSCQISTETFEAWTIDMPGNDGYNPVKSDDCGNLPVSGTYLPNSGTNYLAYTGHFGGTSCSCPQVSGVAALILSLNPTLTQQQVSNIVNSTARKAGGYTYSTTSGISNGTWNSQMGRGVLNAYAAVQAVCLPVNFINQIVTADTTVTSCGDINVQNVKVRNGAKLTLDAGGEVNIISDFEVESGSEFEIVYP